MYCPKCGVENLDAAQACRSCGVRLSPPRVPSTSIVLRRSRLAIAAFVLAVLSPFTCGLSILPAIVLGIVSVILINRSGGRLTGINFALLAIIGPVILVFFAGFFAPAAIKMRQTAQRMKCDMNLSGIGKAMLVYANDYDGQFPRSAGKGGQWAMTIQNWRGNNRYVAYGLASDGSGGRGTISSCFYLLVKYGNVEPKSFICPGDSGSRQFKPANDGAGDRELTDLWDFGTQPQKRCSYSYHQPFSQYPLTTSSGPGMAVAADRNPWIASPADEGKAAKFAQFNPEGGRKAVRIGNAIQHQEDGQNVLFMDNHVNFEKNAFCGVNDDNIYTSWGSVASDPRKGIMPSAVVGPMDKTDSYLVHDSQGLFSGR